MSSNILGPAIKYIRKYRRMTQTDLSRKTGLKQNSISGHENQIRSLDEIDISNYAEALNVRPQTLYTIAQKLQKGEKVVDTDIDKDNDSEISKSSKAQTIAAHLETKGDLSEDELNDIMKYIDYVFKKKF